MGTTTTIVLSEPLERSRLVTTAEEADLHYQRASGLRANLAADAARQGRPVQEVVAESTHAAAFLRDFREVAERPRTEFEIVDSYDGMVSGQTSVVIDGDRVGLRDAGIIEAIEYLPPNGSSDEAWQEWLGRSFTYHTEPLTCVIGDYHIDPSTIVSLDQKRF